MLVAALIIGALWPPPGKILQQADLGGICFVLKGDDEETCVFKTVSNYLIGLIFILSGLKLRTREIKEAFKEWKAALFGIMSILWLSPLLTFWFIDLNFKIKEFALGFSVFFAQATTLSSGTIIVGQANGNVALSLLMTISTNILSVLTMPLFVVRNVNFYVSKHINQTSSDVDVEVSPLPIMLQLVCILLIPLLIGKILSSNHIVHKISEDLNLTLKIIASLLISMILWMNISNSAEDLKEVDAKSVVVVFVAGLAVHIALLVFNFLIAEYVLKLEDSAKRAVVINASQKTFPISLTVLDLIDESLIGSKGLAAIALIAPNFMQLLCDAFVAAYWAGRTVESVLDEPYKELPPESDSLSEEKEEPTKTNDTLVKS